MRAFRRKQAITVANLAKFTGLSLGILSNIENGMTSPSLKTLQILANALSVPITAFFHSYEEKREAVFVNSGTGAEVERSGPSSGHQYSLLGHHGANSSGVIVELYLITLTEVSDTFSDFHHDGAELIYMLEGRVQYCQGDNLFELEAGVSLFFDADALHGPTILKELPARYLSIISYSAGS